MGQYNFNFKELAKNVSSAFPNATMVYPFTYLVPEDASADLMVDTNLTVWSNTQNDTLLVNLTNGKQAMCLNPFNPQLIDGYLSKVFAKQTDVMNDRTAFWLDRNMPTLVGGTNLSANNESNPFFNLPYIPGAVPLAQNTLPENAIHYTGDGYFYYHFDVQIEFGDRFAN